MKAKTAPVDVNSRPQPQEIKGKPILAVDPGIGGTGIAVWRADILRPCFTAVLNAPKKASWWSRAYFIAQDVAEIATEYKVQAVVCECPQFFQSAGGEMVAGRGDLVKLAIAVGAVLGHLAAVKQTVDFWPIEVNEWKGQLSKENVNRRIIRILSAEDQMFTEEDFKSHAWDAVGIGLFARGDFA